MNELRASANLMTLEAGLFCIVLAPSPAANAASGLPGVRVSLPPSPVGRPEGVTIRSFRDDGWLSGFGDAALVRVVGGPAQVLVTVYQAPEAAEGAPSLQVLRLIESPGAAPPAATAGGRMPELAATGAGPQLVDMVAHIQGRGDVGAMLGERLGEPGSRRWIEGFAVAPVKGVAPGDIEYQAVLGRDWLSPWVEGGQFCGSRGMALPVLGFRLRLRGAAAEAFTCTYSASFLDGSEAGPVAAGEACEAASLAPMESFLIALHPRVPAGNTKAGSGKSGGGKSGGAKAGEPKTGDSKAGDPKAGGPRAGGRRRG
ncbi:MAG: hypothetical protein KGL55_05885 [Rhodospirillales bacterium]|nr:hypothetical protein [Rhodospirillales bacterium]